MRLATGSAWRMKARVPIARRASGSRRNLNRARVMASRSRVTGGEADDNVLLLGAVNVGERWKGFRLDDRLEHRVVKIGIAGLLLEPDIGDGSIPASPHRDHCLEAFLLQHQPIRE